MSVCVSMLVKLFFFPRSFFLQSLGFGLLYAHRQPVKGTGEKKKKLHFVHCNAPQIVFFMFGHRKSRNAASNLTTGLHHEPHPTKCPSVDTRRRNDRFTGRSPGDEGGGGGQIRHALRVGVACGRGFRCVVGGSHPRCCGRTYPRITSLLQGRWRWHEQGGRTIWRWGRRSRLGARGLGSGGLWLWRVVGWTLLLLRSNGLLLQLQQRPSGSDLDGRVLGTSVPWTFAHPVVPCLRSVLCVAGVQLGWCGGGRWWCQWATGFPKR